MPNKNGRGKKKRRGIIVDQIWDGAPDEAERQRKKRRSGSRKSSIKITFGTKKNKRR